jgi:hypothetical protein
MRLSRTTLIWTLLVFFTSCIEEYEPVINDEDSGLYVVQGRVTNLDGFQTISVTRSSEVSDPEVIPVEGCEVRIINDQEDIFQAMPTEPGNYLAYIDPAFLTDGAAFMVEITTPTGDLLQSDFDTLKSCSAIDSVYYNIEEFVTNDPDVYIPGIQFYIDFDGTGLERRKIKFEIEETWKYQMEYPIRWTWDGRTLTTYDPPDYSKYICWKTTNTGTIYTLTTENLNANVFRQFPLHHILNNSNKLLMGYSVLFRQLAVSDPVYHYFEKIKDNVLENGGLYETQPQQIEGNISNVSDPETRVLGYFYAAGASQQRQFITTVEGLELNPADFCDPIPLDLGYRFLRNLSEPMYLLLEGGQFTLDKLCVDCTARGGVTNKPDFWPE